MKIKKPTYCGPGKGLGDSMVPDYILGLYIGDCCFGHDTDYRLKEDKCLADLCFWYSMKNKINKYGGWFRIPRLKIARIYYLAVHHFGQSSFDKVNVNKRNS